MSVFEEVVIRGETSAGRKFRPSDWAERLCGLFSMPGQGNRMCYSPHVFPVTREGVVCVVINKTLATDKPMEFAFLMGFARDNDLMVAEGRKKTRD
ncbi:MAG: DUF3579 domain-containing protein [Thiobacillaceae bacterium]|jgi:hypothetical protein|nr:DUF3579 domain-containing protein [Thiobacillaceae bacterium]